MSWSWITALPLAVAVGACADPPSSCPADEPAACPSQAPSYASDVAPLIQTYCTTQCHNPTGVASSRPLSTYNEVHARLTTVHSQLYQCVMPPAGAPTPTVTERVTLLSWFVCGAPNN
jgi:hypothetical protein